MRGELEALETGTALFLLDWIKSRTFVSRGSGADSNSLTIFSRIAIFNQLLILSSHSDIKF
jgi:hypothetical protein